MKVLLLARSLGHGGAEQLLLQQVERPSAISYLVAATGRRPNEIIDEIEAAGVVVHRLGRMKPHDVRWAAALRRLLVDEQVDVVHVHSPFTAAVARCVVRTIPRGGRPSLMYTEHNQWRSHHWATRLINRATIWLDDENCAVSQDVADQMGWPARRPVQVALHGVDVAGIRAACDSAPTLREEIGLHAEALTIATVANLRPQKDHTNLLRALALLPENVHAVLIGTGPLQADIEVTAKELGVEERVHLLGYRPDARQLVAGADVFCLSSQNEGRPVALMEAMTLGVAPVVTAAGGMPDMVEHGVSGVIVPVGDSDALSAALSEVLLDRFRRVEISEAAAAAADAFDERHAFDWLEQRYDALSPSGRSAR